MVYMSITIMFHAYMLEYKTNVHRISQLGYCNSNVVGNGIYSRNVRLGDVYASLDGIGIILRGECEFTIGDCKWI